MSNLSLPPRLSGNTRATLELRIEALLLTSLSAKQKIRKSNVKVFVRWWGQSLKEGIYFSPRVVQSLGLRRDSSPSSRGIRVAVFKVVTGKKRFGEYLQDAERLFLEIHSNADGADMKVVGYSIMERLSRLIQSNSISEDTDIFDEKGTLIGKLRCQMFYEPLGSDIDSCENSQADSIAIFENVDKVATSKTVDRIAHSVDRVATTQISDTFPLSENRDEVSLKDVPVHRLPSRIPTITLKSKLPPSRSDPCLARYDTQPTKGLQKPKVTFADENKDFSGRGTENYTKEPPAQHSKMIHTSTKRPQSAEMSAGKTFVIHPSNAKPVKRQEMSPERKRSSMPSKEQGMSLVNKNFATKDTTTCWQPQNNKNRKQDEPMYTEQPKDDFSAQNAMYIEDNEVLEDTKSENNFVEQKDANFTQKSSKISDSNVYTGKSVDANDVCVGADFDAHNSSGLRRFLLRSNQSHHVDDVTTFKSHQSATSYLDVPISTNTRLFEKGEGFLETSSSTTTRRWNLNNERLKEISLVNQLSIKIRKIRFSQQFMASFLATSANSRFEKKPFSVAAVQKTSATEKEKNSFFVNFSLPPRGDEVSCCSVKRDGIKSTDNRVSSATSNRNKPVTDDIEFESKSLHPVKFDQKLLDIWFTQNLTFKIYSRTLNQRVPTYIGESSFALKHLLLSARHSSGQELKIPIYAATNLLKQISEVQKSSPSEIIGDLFLDFGFISSSNKNVGKINKNVVEVNNKNVEKNDSAKISLEKVRIISHSKVGSDENIVLAPRTVIANQTDPAKPCNVLEPSDVDKIPVRDFSKSLSNLPSHDLTKFVSGNQNITTSTNRTDERRTQKLEKDQIILQSLLVISEGRDFSIRDTSIRNLFVSCRFLGSGSLLTSQICWNIDKPNFNFRHSIPIELNESFLESCCKSNFLILEVWSFSEPKDKLVGVATIPLHPIYVAYQFPKQRDLVLSLELPVITIDNWVEVHDVLSGQVVGSIHAVFAMGKECQIATYLDRIQDDRSGSQLRGRHNSDCPSTIDISTSKTTDIHDSKNIHNFLVSSDKTSSSTSTTQVPNQIVSQSIKDSSALGERSGSSQSVILQVEIEEARNLPRIKSRDFEHRLPPNAYVTLPNLSQQPSSAQLPVSKIVAESCCPTWNFSSELQLPKDYFSDSKQHLIVKVWHCPLPHDEVPTSDRHMDVNTNLIPDFEQDPIIGFVAVDLSPLTLHQAGFDKICGWYNIMDFVGRCRGQVKLTVKPLNLNEIQEQSKRNWTSLDLSSDEETCSSHRSPVLTGKDRIQIHPNREKDSEPNFHLTDGPIQTNRQTVQNENVTSAVAPKECYWKLPEVQPEVESATKSFLASKLSDLDDLAEKLKARLNQKVATKDGQFQNSNSQNASKLHLRHENAAFTATQNVTVQSSFQPQNIDSSTMTSAYFERPDLNLEQLVQLSDDEGAEQNQRRDLLTFSVSPSGSESEFLPELANINWSVVSPDSVRRFEATKNSALNNSENERKSRLAPEGGNPVEDSDN